MRSIGIIPARGGSKGVPRKNLRMLGGESLVARCVRCALATTSLEKVVVSTDDDEIATVAIGVGVDVVRRPLELATDDSPTTATLTHVLGTLDATPRWTVTLEPTAPFRRAETVDRCMQLAEERDAGSVVTVRADSSTFGRLDSGGNFAPLVPDAPRSRQLREPVYAESGTVWVTRTAGLLAEGSVLVEPVLAVVVSEREAIDINTELDLTIARSIFETGAQDEKLSHR